MGFLSIYFFPSLLLLLICIKAGDAKYNIEDLPTLRYSRPGHVKLAILNSILDPGDPLCGEGISLAYLIQYQIMALKAIDRINADPTILGNITLGSEALENCIKPIVAIAQGLKLAPNTTALENVYLKKYKESLGVVGVVGPISSPEASGLAPVLNLFNMAVISSSASSDSLRDRVKYPNFFRLIPSDSFQAKVVIDIISDFGWTYFSIVHSENNYGYNALKFLWRYARLKGICVADTYPIPDDATDATREQLVRRLSRSASRFPHAVVMMAFPSQMRAILEKVHQMDVGNFIWILGESATDLTFAGLNATTYGSFTLSWHVVLDDDVAALTKETAAGNTNDPFFQILWKHFFGCDIKTAEEGSECWKRTLGDIPSFAVHAIAGINRDIVSVYAHAIEDLVKAHCPEKLTNPTSLLSCVTPDRVLHYVQNIKIKIGDTVREFDEYGEMKIDYQIRQMHTNLEQVGIWKFQSEVVEWTTNLQWWNGEFPESICARPCEIGEFYIQGELPCCWECHRCRDNEYVGQNATKCIRCPYLTWPDAATLTTCVPIPASFMRWTDVYGLGLSLLAGLGLVTTLSIVGLVLRHRHRKVIKGASLPMLSVILTGVLLVFLDVILLIVEPSPIVCITNRISFSLSCTLIYVPLLLKTHRVYLVFAASSKLRRVSPLAKASVQYFLVALMTGIQAGVLTASAVYWPIEARLSMPVVTERYVELSCEQLQIGLLTPLSYNLLLILLCSVIAFLTRKLPDNFNESWYIFLSVSTTLFIWIAFLPTYYTAFYAYHKAALLALALALNGAVTSLCLFGPKIYALFYIDEKDIKITDFSNESFEKATESKTT